MSGELIEIKERSVFDAIVHLQPIGQGRERDGWCGPVARIATHPIRQNDDLLPWNWKPQAKIADAA